MRFPHRVGLCHWCTFKERVRQRLGLKHPMLPNKVWHGDNMGWRWFSGYGVLNENWKLRIEEPDA